MTQAYGEDLSGIESLLRRSAATLRYPATPPLASAVVAALRERPRRAWWPAAPAAVRTAAAAGVAAIVALGAAIAVPQSREALAELVGLQHVRVEVVERLGPPPPVLGPESFARPVSLAQAEGVAGPLRLPTRDGERLYPDGVYLQNNVRAAVLVYEDEGYDLYQMRGGLFGKGVVDLDDYREVSFDGVPAYWIDEGGHIAWSENEYGELVIESRRTVERGTLLWERAGIIYRLETSLSAEEAVEVARSLR